jgi:hypothetical protein
VAAALVAWTLPGTASASQPVDGVVPVARTTGEAEVALSGDRLLLGQATVGKSQVVSVPAGGGRRQTLFSAPAGPRRSAVLYDLAASAERVAFAMVEVDPTREQVLRVSAWAGTPGGPFAPIVSRRAGRWRPVDIQVSGTTVGVTEIRPETGATRHFVFPAAAPGVPVRAPRGVHSFELAGGLVAFIEGGRRLMVRDWASGLERLRYAASGEVDGFDLGENGRVALHVPSKRILEVVDASGAANRIDTGDVAAESDVHLEEDHAVLRSRGRFVADARIAVIDLATGKRRRLSPPSLDLALGDARVDAQGGLVAWAANGCGFVAEVAGLGSSVVPPGPCPRAEVYLEEDQPEHLRGRTARVRLRCVTAPQPGCRGTVRLQLDRPLGEARYRIPAGRRGTVRVRLTNRGRASLRRWFRLPPPGDRALVQVRTTLIGGARPRFATPNQGIVLRRGGS